VQEQRKVADRYQLTAKLGSGGMGVVWRAYDEHLHRVVAVKELVSHNGMDEEVTRRAMREGRIAARVSHPNAIALYDVIEDAGSPWLVMEYLPSKSLSAVLSERGALPPEEVVKIGGQLAAALQAAHRAGVVHRDVKPANVLVSEFGTVKITDFGISRAVGDGTATASGMGMGTLVYLAPEVAKGGKADFASDVYSLGATLYTAVEGQPPFGNDSNAIVLLHRVAAGKIRPPEQAGELTPVLLRLLDPDPETRPTMAEAVELLTGAPVPEPLPASAEPTAVMPEPKRPEPEPVPEPVLEAEPPVEVTPVLVAPPVTDDERRKWWPFAAIGAVLVVALVVFLLINRANNQQDPNAGQSNLPTTSAAAQQPAAPGETTTTQAETTTTTTTTTASSAATTTTTTTPSQAPTTADQALANYYKLMPGDLQTGYSRLTDGFKAAHAPSFAAYQQFWSQFSSVQTQNVSLVGENTVSATLVYLRPGGASEEERNVYTLVRQGDQWFIDTQRAG
jgi:serine/threonine protein kinase